MCVGSLHTTHPTVPRIVGYLFGQFAPIDMCISGFRYSCILYKAIVLHTVRYKFLLYKRLAQLTQPWVAGVLRDHTCCSKFESNAYSEAT